MGTRPPGISKVRIRAQFHWGTVLPSLGLALASLVPVGFGLYLLGSPEFSWVGVTVAVVSLLVGWGPFVRKSLKIQSRNCWANESTLYFEEGLLFKNRVEVSLGQIENIRIARSRSGTSATLTIVSGGRDAVVLPFVSNPQEFVIHLEKAIQSFPRPSTRSRRAS